MNAPPIGVGLASHSALRHIVQTAPLWVAVVLGVVRQKPRRVEDNSLPNSLSIAKPNRPTEKSNLGRR